MTRSQLRGYTIVELMMALTLLAVGISGIIAMQKITVAANQHSKNLAMATHIAQAWQDQLAADAAAWNHPSEKQPALRDITDTRWLQSIEGNAGAWVRPVYDATLNFGPQFDALGNVLADADAEQARFCTHVRLTWLYPDASGNGLIRAEVRVFWLREGQGGGVSDKAICSSDNDPTAIGAAPDLYHFVYLTTAIKQNTAY